MLFAPPMMTNAELVWDLPEWSRVLRRGGQRVEVIHMDKRGIGLSDRVSRPPTIDDHVADMVAVLDAEEVERAVIAGFSEGGVHAVAMAATHPERVERIVLVGALAYGVPEGDVRALANADDRPWASEAELGDMVRRFIETWGSGESEALARMAPALSRVAHVRAWQERFERQSASPGTLRAFFKSWAAFDVRPYAPRVQCPALVGHALDDRAVHPAHGRWYATNVPHAEYWEWPGEDHAWWFGSNWEEIQDRILDFATTTKPPIRATRIRTVLFTDIVESTRQAASVGDARWSDLLDVHAHIAHQHVTSNGGRVVKSTGDGVLALFDDPERALSSVFALSRELRASGLVIRAGVHTGQVDLRSDGDISGLAVHIAARVAAQCGPDRVLVSRTIRDLLMADTMTSFRSIGQFELKGVEGSWELFEASPSAFATGPPAVNGPTRP
jgi:class 3 adenylate cyclase